MEAAVGSSDQAEQDAFVTMADDYQMLEELGSVYSHGWDKAMANTFSQAAPSA